MEVVVALAGSTCCQCTPHCAAGCIHLTSCSGMDQRSGLLLCSLSRQRLLGQGVITVTVTLTDQCKPGC